MKDKHLQSAMTHARVFTTEIQRPQKRSHNISRPSPMKYQTAHQLYCQSITLWLIFMHLAAFTHNNSSRTASLLSSIAAYMRSPIFLTELASLPIQTPPTQQWWQFKGTLYNYTIL